MARVLIAGAAIWGFYLDCSEADPGKIIYDLRSDRMVSQAPSGSGWQISVFGLMGVLFSEVEGIEFNFLGLSFGVDLDPLAIKLPLVGRKELDSGSSQ